MIDLWVEVARLRALSPEDRQQERERICRALHTQWAVGGGIEETDGANLNPYYDANGDLPEHYRDEQLTEEWKQ